MYKPIDKLQHSFLDFNQPLGMKMNPENRWVRLADSIPGTNLKRSMRICSQVIQEMLRSFCTWRWRSALVIQKKFQFSNRELVEEITKNPYLQYFIVLPGYQDEPPFDPSTLVLFRKRLDVDAIMDANALMFDHRNDDDNPPFSGPSSNDASSSQDKTEPGMAGNQGTLSVNATCAPANIKYP